MPRASKVAAADGLYDKHMEEDKNNKLAEPFLDQQEDGESSDEDMDIMFKVKIE